MYKKLEVVKDMEYSPIRSFTDANPYTIAFVYPRNGKGIVVKGGANAVEEFIKIGYPVSLVYLTFWKDGIHRSFASIYGMENVYLNRNATNDKGRLHKKHWELVYYPLDSKEVITKRYRKPPRGFPNILKLILKEKYGRKNSDTSKT